MLRMLTSSEMWRQGSPRFIEAFVVVPASLGSSIVWGSRGSSLAAQLRLVRDQHLARRFDDAERDQGISSTAARSVHALLVFAAVRYVLPDAPHARMLVGNGARQARLGTSTDTPSTASVLEGRGGRRRYARPHTRQRDDGGVASFLPNASITRVHHGK